mmetsp:Transcript_52253/g.93729  ORF Transcript_52253/g.93729 Transcript_52253/m.93729 type:complete len:216 (+) Transcript_52253:61-708(+)
MPAVAGMGCRPNFRFSWARRRSGQPVASASLFLLLAVWVICHVSVLQSAFVTAGHPLRYSGAGRRAAASETPEGSAQKSAVKAKKKIRVEVDPLSDMSIMSDLEQMADQLDRSGGYKPQEYHPVYAFFQNFSFLLVLDIFVILICFAWFLLGVGLEFGLKTKVLITPFVSLWDPWIQGIIGILFGARAILTVIEWNFGPEKMEKEAAERREADNF